MRDRRLDEERGAAIGIADVAAAIALRLMARATRRPVDTLAILGAGAVSLIIIVNAVFLQSGTHPAPFFVNPTRPPAAPETRAAAASPPAPKPAEPTIAAHAAPGLRAPQTVSVRRNDPIADLIGSSIGSPSRVAAVQRALAEFGYGQVRPSGVLDGPTSAAIEKFEREHKLPATGRLTDRLLTELAAMIGHPLD